MLDRAMGASYAYGSVKNFPEDWRRRAFVERDGEFCLGPPFRRDVTFSCQDVRRGTPPGIFDLISCRNLAFTYFDDEMQRQILQRLANILHPNRVLILVIPETRPKDFDGFIVWSQRFAILQRRD
jgi:chemotaxis protein methyltransferase CheR